MNKTKIEWCDFTINPIKGICRNDCWYCYAKRMYKRFGWYEHIRQDYLVFSDMPKKPSRIFIGSTHDIFGDWIPYHWIQDIINYCKYTPQHTFIFLTKNPERYAEFVFPENCLLGATVTEKKDLWRIDTMRNIKGFISVEPLLEDVSDLSFRGIDWIIIGGLTPRPVHKKEWVDGIIKQARQLSIPIFLKDNLNYPEEIKEYPDVLEGKNV